MRTVHLTTGASARDIRRYLIETRGLAEGEDIFHLAQVLSFMIHDTSIEKISAAMQTQSNRFAVRKLQSVLSLLDNVFSS